MNRVVVTGIGLVTPLGDCPREFRDRLLAGESGIGSLTLFDPQALPTRIAAEVRPQGPLPYRDRKVSFALQAARDAIADAGRSGTSLAEFHPAGSGGLCLGTGLELFSMPDLLRHISGTGPEPGVHPLTFLQTPSDICLPLIAREHGLGQPPLTHISACAASTDALGMAFELIRSGRRRWLLAGGTDSMINPMGVAGFCRIQAMSTRNGEPTRASRPFDRQRDGFVLGEGAALLVLESLTDARARGAAIHGEILGYGNSFDAHGISEPHPEGAGAATAMRRALASAGIQPTAIRHINAHGTSTPKNDAVETAAIRTVFGSHADALTVSATKSMIGHLISASGAVEVAALLLCAAAGWAHPTCNLEDPDPACDLDYVPREPRRLAPGALLKNSFGFGGQNASLVLRAEEA